MFVILFVWVFIFNINFFVIGDIGNFCFIGKFCVVVVFVMLILGKLLEIFDVLFDLLGIFLFGDDDCYLVFGGFSWEFCDIYNIELFFVLFGIVLFNLEFWVIVGFLIFNLFNFLVFGCELILEFIEIILLFLGFCKFVVWVDDDKFFLFLFCE